MKLLILSSAPFIFGENQIQAYSPYLDEMAIWARHADQVAFCCPVWKQPNGLLVKALDFKIARHFRLLDFSLNSWPDVFKAVVFCLYDFVVIFKAMLWADHIHLRCPGNMGLLGCIAQILFPFKEKTAKYAGNWDPSARQPFTYKLQKSILNNTFLTRKMAVLIYGQWPNMSRNLKPFFTASYKESDKRPLQNLPKDHLDFVFAGMLTAGKNPMYAILLVEALCKSGIKARLQLFGEGAQRVAITDYLQKHQLENCISLKGNQPKEVVAEVLRNSHFVILPSESEGWPKALAEGMFWGCIPVATPVSAVPYMLDYGNRGIILTLNLEQDLKQLQEWIAQAKSHHVRESASAWSREFTLETFESSILKILNK